MEVEATKSYQIKDLTFFGQPRWILMQSVNGPCPLLAICNVLLLRNQLSISPNRRNIGFDELVAMVSNLLFDLNDSEGDAGSAGIVGRAGTGGGVDEIGCEDKDTDLGKGRGTNKAGSDRGGGLDEVGGADRAGSAASSGGACSAGSADSSGSGDNGRSGGGAGSGDNGRSGGGSGSGDSAGAADFAGGADPAQDAVRAGVVIEVAKADGGSTDGGKDAGEGGSLDEAKCVDGGAGACHDEGGITDNFHCPEKEEIAASRAANLHENLGSCLEVLPKLNRGLDVNVRFSGVKDFECTKELAIFDLLNITLYHGWLVSRQDEIAFGALGQLTYNQAVERVVALQDLPNVDLENVELDTVAITEQGLLIQDFLDRTGSQLSYDGLLALHDAVQEKELGVLFRNSHFNTMLKHDGFLYLLCTDVAFARSSACWERLDALDGDTAFFDLDFKECAFREEGSWREQSGLGDQLELDRALALQLTRDEDVRSRERSQSSPSAPGAAAKLQPAGYPKGSISASDGRGKKKSKKKNVDSCAVQ